MASTLEQFIRFGTDTAGLERLLRLIQSVLQVTIFYPPVLDLFLAVARPFRSDTRTDHASVLPILAGLKSQAALTRRFFRVFRFAESFHSAHRLWTSLDVLDRVGWLDVYLSVFGRTFNGMYLMLEASLLLDALGIEGLHPWGSRGAAIALEAQRFWFFSLVCGVLGGTLRFLELWFRGLPDPEKTATGEDGSKRKNGSRDGATAIRAGEARRRDTAARSYAIGRRLLADVLDLAVPGSVVGYVKADAGSVGLAMLVTSVLTGAEVWERCGREVQ